MNKNQPKSEQAKRREALEALRALGYWDFETIKSALDMAHDYLEKNHPEGAICDAEGCLEIKEKVATLMAKARQLFA